MLHYPHSVSPVAPGIPYSLKIKERLSSPTLHLLPTSLPLWLTAGYIALFIIRPWERLFPSLSDLRIERWWGLALLASLVLSSQLRFRLRRSSNGVYVFFVALALTTATALDLANSFSVFYLYFTQVVIFIAFISTIRSLSNLIFVWASYIAVMAMYLSKSLWEYFVHGAGEFEMGVYRLKGIESTFGDPNSLAPSIVFTLPFLAFLFSFRRLYSARWPKALQQALKAALLLYIPLALAALFLTRSRTGVVLLAAFALLYGLRPGAMGKKAGRVLVVAALGFGVFFLLPLDIQQRVQTLWDPAAGPKNAQQSATGRMQGFKAGVAIMKEYPLLGIGPGNYTQYRGDNIDGIYLAAHNVAGQSLAEVGIVGTFAFVLFFTRVLWICRRTRLALIPGSGPINDAIEGIALACRECLLLLLIQGVAGHNLYRFNWVWVAAFALVAWHLALLQRTAAAAASPAAAAPVGAKVVS